VALLGGVDAPQLAGDRLDVVVAEAPAGDFDVALEIDDEAGTRGDEDGGGAGDIDGGGAGQGGDDERDVAEDGEGFPAGELEDGGAPAGGFTGDAEGVAEGIDEFAVGGRGDHGEDGVEVGGDARGIDHAGLGAERADESVVADERGGAGGRDETVDGCLVDEDGGVVDCAAGDAAGVGPHGLAVVNGRGGGVAVGVGVPAVEGSAVAAKEERAQRGDTVGKIRAAAQGDLDHLGGGADAGGFDG